MEDLIPMPVRQPVWVLEYEKKDISAAIAPYVLQVTYTDHLQGESDELEINIEDKDHRWKNGWFPGKGDTLRLSIGYRGEKLMTCGTFQIDEIELNGPPDTITLRALAAGVKPALRTVNSAAYEDRTLKQIAEEVARKHGLSLVGTVPEITVERITQNREQDLSFLKRLADAYGYVFSVRGEQLVWHDLAKLDAATPVTTIDRKQLLGFTFRSKTSQVYRGCQVSYFDPRKKKLVSHTFPAKGVTTGDVLKLSERCESKAQAEIKAQAALRNSNGKQVEGAITIQGDPRLVAGTNIGITGLGVLDNIYQVLKSRHTMDRSAGYKTELELSTTSAHVTMKNLKNGKKYTKVTR